MSESQSPSFDWTNDGIAVIACTVPWVFAGSQVYLGQDIALWLVTILVTQSITATVWVFGKGAFKAGRELISDGNYTGN